MDPPPGAAGDDVLKRFTRRYVVPQAIKSSHMTKRVFSGLCMLRVLPEIWWIPG
jgi:hypothetical protein